jgi:sulfotransferase
LLEKQKEETEQRMNKSMTNLVEGWYEGKGKEVIFDKSRGWNTNHLMLKHLYPSAKIIVCVRDLRNVYSSVEKQHRKNPLLDGSIKTIYEKADKMFSPDGMLGGCIQGVEDIIRRDVDAIYVKYEALAANPDKIMRQVYDYIDEDYYMEHNFDNVENVSIDCDGFYLNKFPHLGCGKVSPGDPKEYEKFLAPDLAKTIYDRFESYNKFFNY